MPGKTNACGQPIGEAVPQWSGARRPARIALEGNYCLVQPLDVECHMADLFDAFEEDEEGKLWTYMFAGPFSEQGAFRVWLEAAAASADPHFFALVDRGSGRAAGVAAYMRIKADMGVIEIGNIIFAPVLQRTPAATEAMFLLMQHVFDELGYRRYEWKCDSLNAASQRAAARLGFHYDGLFRQAIVYKGRNRDTAWYSILDSDWPVLKSAYLQWLAADNFDASGRQLSRLPELIESARAAAALGQA